MSPVWVWMSWIPATPSPTSMPAWIVPPWSCSTEAPEVKSRANRVDVSVPRHVLLLANLGCRMLLKDRLRVGHGIAWAVDANRDAVIGIPRTAEALVMLCSSVGAP